MLATLHVSVVYTAELLLNGHLWNKDTLVNQDNLQSSNFIKIHIIPPPEIRTFFWSEGCPVLERFHWTWKIWERDSKHTWRYSSTAASLCTQEWCTNANRKTHQVQNKNYLAHIYWHATMKINWTAKPPTLRLYLPGFWAKLRILYTSSSATTILPPSMRTRKHSVAIKLGLPDFGSWMFFSSFLGAQPQGSVSRDRVKKILQVASLLSSHAAVSAMSLVLVSDNWSVQCATQHVRTTYSKLQLIF